jgi:hypothetical protein
LKNGVSLGGREPVHDPQWCTIPNSCTIEPNADARQAG